MVEPIIILIITLLYFVYFLMGFSKVRTTKFLFAVFFIVLSYLLKTVINISKTADYENYLYIIADAKPEFSFKMLFEEPYFFYLGSWLCRYFPKKESLEFFYDASFIYTTIFFIWLAFLKNISSINKIIVLSLYYFFFAYIVLRNAPAYILSSVCFYYLHQNKYIKFTVISFLTHLTVVPAIIFSKFKNKLGDKKLLFMCLIFIATFNLLINIPFFGISEKFAGYADEKEYGQSIFHKVYFIVVVVLNLYLYRIKKDIIFNYTYLFLFAAYLVANYSNAVMGYRFSIYLILYLMINPQLNYSLNTKRILILVVPLCFVLFIFNYLTLQK